MKKFAIAALAALTFATPAFAGNDPVLWKALDRWRVYTDPNLDGGCYMHATYGDDFGMRIGFDMHRGTAVGFIMLMSQRWASLIEGQHYSIQIKFDGTARSGWATWTAVAGKSGLGTPAILMPFSNADMIGVVGAATAVHFSYEGRAVLDANLPGSMQAMHEVALCTTTMRADAFKPNDPFRGGGRTAPVRDPFTPL